ncbi:AH receptor-interacting protein [Pseudolycoriella hygida]|uniref:AH receptor-interacting protein n=1 Tax=Pseudolycoriella hygida TaxID=35572 RepID=A0A9Q0RZ65_9DIPT|nr:AH receptor-interacting protein [Pseudolycoriella hygida]
MLDSPLIKKETLHPGTKCVEFKPGTKVKFHFVTKKSNGKVLDDSRKDGVPMELVLGKKFKLEVWEVIVQKMSLNEVSRFIVDKSLVPQYPFISKTLRDARKPPEERKHCCGMTIQNEGIGYEDLNELFTSPCDLEFIIELLSVSQADEYEKESWQLNESEKSIAIEQLRLKGNQFYKEKNYTEAEQSYRNALGMVEQLILKEKPHDEEWLELIKVKIPILLNYAQCRLLDKDYYAVIEHCTEVLKHEPKNVKALYRRAKAHAAVWNTDNAKEDYHKCATLDPSLAASINKELKLLAEAVRQKDLEDKIKYQNIF